MFRKIDKLIREPAFRHRPFSVIGRLVFWAGCVLLKHRPVFRLTAAGERLSVPPTLGYTSLSAFILRDESEPELHELDLFVHPGDTFVDVGANIGLYTLKAARLSGPQGRVLAAEPGRAAREQLAANLALNTSAGNTFSRNTFAQVTVIDSALSDAPGEATLHHVDKGNDPQAFSLLADGTEKSGETVAVTTLDRAVSASGLARVDCIKIDVEGFEARVIRGAGETLARWHPTVIFEVNCPTLLQSGEERDGAWKLLEAHGYRFFRLVDGAVTPLSAMPATFGNVIARFPAG
ncbi:FkbM family methyltransferase [Pseudochelatococcus sp. B33]